MNETQVGREQVPNRKKGPVPESDSQIPHHCRQTEGPGHTTLLLPLSSHNLKVCQPPGQLQCGELKQKGPGVILQGEVLMCLARSKPKEKMQSNPERTGRVGHTW